jgi:UDP-2,4-diacetamido-2,4,6-trideoxy-beta-L-altropyranose hydrolase
MNVVFRVDASNLIGSGHVMRCLTLAELLRESGSIVSFITRSHVGNLDNLIKSKEFKVFSLPEIHKFELERLDSYEKWLGVVQSMDAKETIKRIDNTKPDLLVIDHYSLDIEWESILRPHVKSILVIDDMANRKHDCDWLLDQNYTPDNSRYNSLVPPGSIKILGPKYSLLRKEFLSYRRTINHNLTIKRVFIFFGGADPFGLTLLCLKSLQHPKLKHLSLDVVIGSNNLHINEIELFSSKLENTVLHVQVNNIAQLMSSADISIGAGGSTTWERFLIGLPSLVITFGKDQELSIKELENNNYITWLGNVNKINQDKLSKMIINLIKDSNKLMLQSTKAKKLVDGLGANRVLEIIKNSIEVNRISSRKANDNDLKLYWEWVNENEVRKNAFSQSFIEWEDHQRWFIKNLKNPKVILLVIERDLIPIGQVRFNKKGRKYHIDYSLSKEFRRKGLAIPMLNKAIDYFKLIRPVILYAEVKNTNIASLKVFDKMGFIAKESNMDSDKVFFELKINS